VVRARTPTYGYFAMLPFVLPWIRRQKVEWFMDQYVTARAYFPNGQISYVGHSNGTYLAARALRDYAAATFKHLFFAGSVVRRDFDWLSPIREGRLVKLHNIPAAGDWVVALLPKSVEWYKKFDLGGAGFDGFNDAGKHANITQPKAFAKGGHSAAIAEVHWDHIARFVIDGTVPPEQPEQAYVPSRVPWLRWLAELHLGLPILFLLLVILIPLVIARPLLPLVVGHGLQLPTDELSLFQGVVQTLLIVGYFLLLKFVVTRV
jgi:pimeloyl-ACP methyl ester carboxylesterase